MSDKRHPGPVYSNPKRTKRVLSSKSVPYSQYGEISSKKRKQNKKKMQAKRKMQIKRKSHFSQRGLHFFMTAVLTALTVLVILWIVFISPVFALSKNHINITGTGKYIEAQSVINSLNKYIGTPITILNIRDLEKEIFLQNGVASVDIERLWINGLSVKIVQSVPLAYIEFDKQFILLDKDGKTTQINAKPYNDFPQISFLDGDKLTQPFILKALSEFSQEFRKNIFQISAKTFDSITTKLNDGKTVIWGSNEYISKKEAIVKKILENSKLMSDKRVVDISATYKPIIK
ncbi:MAG: cell division protein FtsQ/DivIB [Bifidobacteriaceae bacterium]|jgi:cell division protein FtsQ|nr:cell division protein FtsQ/DivIB [Bifidobacteriaceae bacterium]